MDRKKLLMIAAAGLLATRPAMSIASSVETVIDAALDQARQEVRNEQPLVIGSPVHASDDAATPQMY